MDRKKTLSLLLFTLFFASAIVLGFLLYRNLKKNSGIQVDSFPKARVYLNDKDLGLTPVYKEDLSAGNYNLKLVAKTDRSDTTYEAKIKLVAGVVTSINRVFGKSSLYSSGQEIFLEKLGVADGTSLSVVSDPDGSLVSIDGEEKGITPITIKDLSAGPHDIVVARPGYDSLTVSGKIEKGYELTALIKLAKASEDAAVLSNLSGQVAATSSAAGKDGPPAQVLILETPTGFLRVRFLPSITASESGKVTPGEKYLLLEESNSWFKIKLPSGSGWISSQYGEKIK